MITTTNAVTVGYATMVHAAWTFSVEEATRCGTVAGRIGDPRKRFNHIAKGTEVEATCTTCAKKLEALDAKGIARQ
jgi:hypothetical protein